MKGWDKVSTPTPVCTKLGEYHARLLRDISDLQLRLNRALMGFQAIRVQMHEVFCALVDSMNSEQEKLACVKDVWGEVSKVQLLVSGNISDILAD